LDRRAGQLLFEIGADEVNEVLGYFLRGERGAAALHHVLADVVFEDLGHEAVDTARNSGLSTSGDVGFSSQHLRAKVKFRLS
jgi:hypothetical protein